MHVVIIRSSDHQTRYWNLDGRANNWSLRGKAREGLSVDLDRGDRGERYNNL